MLPEPRRSRQLVKRRTQGKKDKNNETAAKESRKEAKPSRGKSHEPRLPRKSRRRLPPKPGTDKDKEEYDVSEVPPVVTHHQITVDGKLLKYTATAGRLPIKRGDGKIEAEMFFVAYTLDGQDAASVR